MLFADYSREDKTLLLWYLKVYNNRLLLAYLAYKRMFSTVSTSWTWMFSFFLLALSLSWLRIIPWLYKHFRYWNCHSNIVKFIYFSRTDVNQKADLPLETHFELLYIPVLSECRMEHLLNLRMLAEKVLQILLKTLFPLPVFFHREFLIKLR